MKFCVILVCLVAGLTTCLCSKDFENKLLICARENGLDKEALKKMFDNGDPKLSCLAACVLIKDKIIVNNRIDKNRAIIVAEKEYGLSNKEELEKIITICADEANKKGDACSKAGDLLEN